MTIDQAIERLEELRKEAGTGQIEVVSITDVAGVFAVNENHIFDIVEIPAEALCVDFGVSQSAERVCALMEPVEYNQIAYPPLKPIPGGIDG